MGRVAISEQMSNSPLKPEFRNLSRGESGLKTKKRKPVLRSGAERLSRWESDDKSALEERQVPRDRNGQK